MQYQTKWMRNMLKLFASRQSSLIRTLLVAGLLIGCLGVAFASLQQSLPNAQARAATPQNFGQARSVSITVSSHIDDLKVTYTLFIHTAVNAVTLRRGIPITFTDSIPVGLSQISAKGNYWDTKVSSKVGPSLVTGTYNGSYPIGPGATLPAVSIEGTINRYASNALTNSASVNVWGNTDKTHSKAVVSDNIKPALSSLPLLNSNDKSSTCYERCNISDENACGNSCNQQVSDACDNSCGSSQSSSNACDNPCAQESGSTSVQQQVHISVSDSESTDTSCECSQQGTENGSTGTPSTVTSHRKDPFPTLPNTGSDPNSKG